MKFHNSFLFVLFFTLFSFSVGAQVFGAQVIGGINATQLEGDNLKGFDKIGLHAGLGINYQLFRKSLKIELLFNQKGSSSTTSLGMSKDRQSINLNYFQIPVLFSLDHWYSEQDDFYRISLDGGLYYARLFSVSSSNSLFDGLTEDFRKNDYGIVIGARYRFISSWAFGLRYDHSFQKVFRDPGSGLTGLLSYLVTFRTEYFF